MLFVAAFQLSVFGIVSVFGKSAHKTQFSTQPAITESWMLLTFWSFLWRPITVHSTWYFHSFLPLSNLHSIHFLFSEPFWFTPSADFSFRSNFNCFSSSPNKWKKVNSFVLGGFTTLNEQKMSTTFPEAHVSEANLWKGMKGQNRRRLWSPMLTPSLSNSFLRLFRTAED